MKRPITTLFLLSSVDGKISTGANDTMDVDRDYPTIDGVKEGLHQYYEIEQTTDLWSLNSGRVMAKVGANENPAPPKTPVSFVIIDNKRADERSCEVERFGLWMVDKRVDINVSPCINIQPEINRFVS